MKDLNTYKLTLKEVEKKLKHFDQDRLDSDYLYLQKAFDICFDYEIFNLSDIEKEKVDIYKFELFKHLTNISGGLSFLAIQILAANAIMKGNEFTKKEEYFKKKCGIAINHLRSPFTIVSANKVHNGYKLTGTLTWASGYKIFDTLLIGFRCDGLEYESVARFEPQNGFNIGDTDKTFVGIGLNTVNIELENFFIPDSNIVSTKQIGSYNTSKSVSKTIHLCIYSVGNSALLYTEDEEFKKSAKSKLRKIKELFLKEDNPQKMNILRVELFELVLDIVTTAITLYGGKAILSQVPLQRLYRELMMFNANGLNNELKEIAKEKFLNKQ